MSSNVRLGPSCILVLRKMRDEVARSERVPGFVDIVEDLHNDPHRQAAFLAAAFVYSGWFGKHGFLSHQLNLGPVRVLGRISDKDVPLVEREAWVERMERHAMLVDGKACVPEEIRAQVGTRAEEEARREALVNRNIQQFPWLEPHRQAYLHILRVVQSELLDDPEHLDMLREMIHDLAPMTAE